MQRLGRAGDGMHTRRRPHVKAVTSGSFFKRGGETVRVTHNETARSEALDWLAGRVQWERLLSELRALDARQPNATTDEPSPEPPERRRDRAHEAA